MLAQAHRLRHRSEFAAVLRGGRRAQRGRLVVHLRLDPAVFQPPRVGFVVSKAVGNAVVRNTVVRRLRHLARDRLGDLPAGAQLVVRALPAAAGASSGQLGADLEAGIAATTRVRRPARPTSGAGG